MSPKAKMAALFLSGALAGILATMLISAPTYLKVTEGLDSARETMDKQKQTIELRDTAIANLTKALAAANGGAHFVTLLYDADALLTMERGAGTAGLVQSFPNDNSAPYPGYPRWIVSGKIDPLLVGDAQGSHYAYFDTSTGKYDGPYLPKTPHTKR